MSVCVSLYGNHAFVRVTSTEKCLVFLFTAIMLLYRSCRLSICLCSLCLCLCVCVCSLYGDHAFVWVMSTEKCVCVCVCVSVSRLVCVCVLFTATMLFAGHVD